MHCLDRFEDVLAQSFARNSAIVSLDKGVLLRVDWLDVFKWDALFLGRYHQVPIDLFWANSDTDGLGFVVATDMVSLVNFEARQTTMKQKSI